MSNIDYKAGETVKTKHGELKILNIDRQTIKYICLKCGNIHHIKKATLDTGSGCSVCCPTSQKVVKDINSVWKTNPEFAVYFKNIEEAYAHTVGSHIKTTFKCPICGLEKEQEIRNAFKGGFRCDFCDDGVSYPEKIMATILTQLNINCETEKIFTWSSNKRYDFYIAYGNKEYILETHGLQHYKETGRKGAKTLKQEQENDKLKKQLALNNEIEEENYIVIDCRHSKLEWIKNNVLNSRMNDIFNLSTIDWEKCEKDASSSRAVEACRLWNEGMYSSTEIADVLKMDRHTILSYLKKGKTANICTYSSELSNKYKQIKQGKERRKPIICVETGDVFDSTVECVAQSEKVFGIKLPRTAISNILNGRRKSTYGLSFRFVDKKEVS